MLSIRKKAPPEVSLPIFSLSWEPIFQLMQSAPGIHFDTDAQESFKTAYIYLNLRVEYAFLNPRMKTDTWKVAYWSVRVQRILIMKFGTKVYKSRLLEQGRRNTDRNQNIRKSIDGRLVKRRRTKKQTRLIQPLPQVPTPLHTPPSISPPTAPPLPRPVLQLRSLPQHQLMRSPVVSRRAKKATPRRVENDIENTFRNVNVEYVQGQIPPPPMKEITPRTVLPGQYGGYRQPVGNQHICDVHRTTCIFFCGLLVGRGVNNQNIRCPPCQRVL